MREINSEIITENIKEMCIQANHYLSDDMKKALDNASDKEESELGKKILGQLQQNLKIAGEEMIPICQDTGMAIIFIEVGQEVHIKGNLEEAINEGVRKGYVEGYLRKSVVEDPINRINTKDNTPAIIHYNIVDGDQIKIIVAPKGFGSENKSKLVMLNPADGEDGIKKVVLDAVNEAGPNACPPLVVGVGIGGNFEMCAELAKRALVRPVDSFSTKEHIRKMEEELLETINNSNIGPGGLGGKVTALKVNIETYSTHIAGLPVAVNMCCHVNRHVVRYI